MPRTWTGVGGTIYEKLVEFCAVETMGSGKLTRYTRNENSYGGRKRVLEEYHKKTKLVQRWVLMITLEKTGEKNGEVEGSRERWLK